MSEMVDIVQHSNCYILFSEKEYLKLEAPYQGSWGNGEGLK